MTKAGDLTRNRQFRMWLFEATRGLCQNARACARAELEAHYSDQVSAAVRDGFADEEGHAIALHGMGNADAARRAFHNVYLTIEDDEWVNELLKRGWGFVRFRWINLLRSFVICASSQAVIVGLLSFVGLLWTAASLAVLCPYLIWTYRVESRNVAALLREDRIKDALWTNWRSAFFGWMLCILFAMVAVFVGDWIPIYRVQGVLVVMLSLMGSILEYRRYSALARKLGAGHYDGPRGIS